MSDVINDQLTWHGRETQRAEQKVAALARVASYIEYELLHTQESHTGDYDFNRLLDYVANDYLDRQDSVLFDLANADTYEDLIDAARSLQALYKTAAITLSINLAKETLK